MSASKAASNALAPSAFGRTPSPLNVDVRRRLPTTMELVAPSNPAFSRRLTIGEGPIDSVLRVGGPGSEGVDSTLLGPHAQFVLTVPLASGPRLCFSLFVNATFRQLITAMNDGPHSDDRVIVILHDKVPRLSKRGRFQCMSEHPLVLGAPEPDLVSDGEGGFVTESRHKIGGRPYCIQEPELPGASSLLERGFIQVLQLDFPGPPDALVSGDWPFGDGLFNLFWHPHATGEDFVWYVQK